MQVFENTIDVRGFGAKGDGVADDTQSIQATLDARKHAWLPPGIYKTSRPIRVPYQGSIRGVGNASVVKNTIPGIPTVLCCTPVQWTPSVPFATAEGWLLDGSYTRWLNLSDSHTCDGLRLHGRNLTITIEFKPDSLPSDGERSLFGSTGSEDDTHETYRSAFRFTQYGSAIRFRFRSNSVHRYIEIPGLAIDEWNKLKLQFNGSDATATIERDGAVVATETQAGVGSIEQAWHESVCIGVQPFRWPEGSSDMGSAFGRIKNAKIEGMEGGSFSVALTNSEGVLFPYYGPWGSNGLLFARLSLGDLWGDCNIQSLRIEAGAGMGIFSTNSPQTRISDVQITGHTRGVWLWQNSYSSRIENVRCFGAFVIPTVGIGCQSAAGTTSIHNCEVQYGQCHFMVDLAVNLSNIYASGGPMIRPLIVKGDIGNVMITGLQFGDEAISAPENTQGALIARADSMCINGFQAWNNHSTHPPLELRDCGGVLVAPSFRTPDSTPEIIKNTGTRPVKVIAPRLVGGQVLSLDGNVTTL